MWSFSRRVLEAQEQGNVPQKLLLELTDAMNCLMNDYFILERQLTYLMAEYTRRGNAQIADERAVTYRTLIDDINQYAIPLSFYDCLTELTYRLVFAA